MNSPSYSVLHSQAWEEEPEALTVAVIGIVASVITTQARPSCFASFSSCFASRPASAASFGCRQGSG